MVIGLTGGIATGKSTVVKMLKEEGFTVLDADEMVHQLQRPGGVLLKMMVELFGEIIRNKDGSLNRKQLGDLIFTDDGARRKLDALIHPMVKAQMIQEINEVKEKHVFLDVPLLFEAGFDDLVDVSVVVSCDERLQIARLITRNGLSLMDAKKRIGAQMPLSDKIRRADFHIQNNDTLKVLQQDVKHMLKKIENIGD